MRTPVMLLVLGLILTATAEARMYQWTHPVTGSVQLSGTPPAWYRASAPGPRTLVFDAGRLVDDTAVAVSELQRRALREQAFTAAAAVELAAPATPSAAEVLRETLARAHADGVDIEAAAAEVNAEQARDAAAQASADVDVASRVVELKALIEAWDQRRLDAARALLQALPAATPEPTPEAR